MTPTWRFIPLLEAAGPVQMALDTWLLEQHIQGKAPPTLRFYTWEPIALSLGYHQHQIPAHWSHLTWEGSAVPLVRRPSGGRAVLHQGDLTYALVGSGFSGDRTTLYRHLCEFLIQGWRSLSVPLHYGTAGRGYIHNPNCFETATGADLVLPNGSKLIGSAQLRRSGCVLQHGSIRLCPDSDLFQQVFGTPICVPDLPLPGGFQERVAIATQALTQAAEAWFGVHLVSQALSPDEWQAVQDFALRPVKGNSHQHGNDGGHC